VRAGAPNGLWWATTGVVVLALLVPVVASGILLEALYNASGALPTPRAGIDSGITRLYDGAGNQIAAFRRFETHVPVTRQDIPQVLRDAVVAIEDRRFYSHKGIDLQALLRALWADLQGGSYQQGGSTITQQYVKRIYTGPERTLARKVREAVLAGRVERELSKNEILYRYLSDVYLGSGAYGVGAAAETYFRTSVKDLTLSQAATLAGLIQSPSRDEPRSNLYAAEARRQAVLRAMLDQHRIPQVEYDQALAQHLVRATETYQPSGATLVFPPQETQSQVPYFVDYVRRYLIARFGEDKVYRGGLRVETTLDTRLQQMAEAAVSGTLAGTSPPLEMALVSLDPNTGYVKVLVGGRDFGASQVNLALGSCAGAPKPEPGGPICIDGGGTGRQPGSSFKAYTLAKAFEEGISPDKVYSAPAAYTIPHCRGIGCTIHNAEPAGFGALPLRVATAESVNTVFAQLILDVGVKETAEMAHRLGITMIRPDGRQPSGEPYGPSLTLGAAEVSPLDMAAAYGVFARRGEQFPATPVLKVTDANGKVLEDNRARQGRRVLSQAIADNVNDVLKGVITSGTGTAADIGRPQGTAGKTGTAEDFSDAWFVGYTQKLVTSVWMGYANSKQPLINIKGVEKVFGGTFPAQTWKAYMSQAVANDPDLPFPPPGPLPPPKGGAPQPPPSREPPPPIYLPPAPVESAPPEPEMTVPTIPPLSIPPYTGPPLTSPTVPTYRTPTTPPTTFSPPTYPYGNPP
jgi:penicillin-binding protein 1A